MAYENGIQRNHYSDVVRHKEVQKKKHMKCWWVYFTRDFDTFCEYEQKRHDWTDDKYYRGYWRMENSSRHRQFFRSCSNSRIRSQERVLADLRGLTLEEIEEFEDSLYGVTSPNRILNKQVNKWAFYD